MVVRIGASALLRRRKMLMNTVGLSKAVPQALRPSVIIQRKAIYDGLLGPSLFWKIVAVWRVPARPGGGHVRAALRAPRPIPHRPRPFGQGHDDEAGDPQATQGQLGLTKAKAYEKAWAEIQDPKFRP